MSINYTDEHLTRWSMSTETQLEKHKRWKEKRKSLERFRELTRKAGNFFMAVAGVIAVIAVGCDVVKFI